MEKSRKNTLAIIMIVLISLLAFTALRHYLPYSLGVTSLPITALHTSGQNVYDASGNKVNIYAACFQHGGWGQSVSLSDIQKIKTMGFNAFRVFLYWGDIQTNPTDPTVINMAFFTASSSALPALDTLVDWAVQNNLYVIFTLTFNEWHLPPAWAFPGVSFSGVGELNTAQWLYLLQHPVGNEQIGMKAVWQALTARYKSVPNILFEFVNEINMPTGTDMNAIETAYKQFNEYLITAIEEAEVTFGSVSRLKLLQLMMENSAWVEVVDSRALDVSKTTNIVWTCHPYAPMTWHNPLTDGNTYNYIDPPGFTLSSDVLHQLYLNGKLTKDYPVRTVYSGIGATDPLWVAYRLQREADKVHSWNKPIMDTEFGKDVRQAGFDVWLDIECGMKEDLNFVGWAYFCYCSLSTGGTATDYFNVNNPTTGSLVLPVISQYILSSNGTPVSTPTPTPTSSSSPTPTPTPDQNATPTPTFSPTTPNTWLNLSPLETQILIGVLIAAVVLGAIMLRRKH